MKAFKAFSTEYRFTLKRGCDVMRTHSHVLFFLTVLQILGRMKTKHAQSNRNRLDIILTFLDFPHEKKLFNVLAWRLFSFHFPLWKS